jgi:serine phosphatase RsbU (regulator of sigma subunit)
MSDVRLEVVGSHGQRVVHLDKPVFTIGRRSTNDLQLLETEISRDHAEIAQLDGGYVIRDRGSRCGTFVNGARIAAERILAHGDQIQLGRTGGAELRFLVEGGPITDSHSGSSIVGGFRQVATLLNSLRAMGSARVLDEVLALVMDAAIEVTGAERGFIMLANEAGELEMKLARLQGRVSLAGTRFDTSRKIPEEVFATGREKIVADLHEGALAQSHEGTIALGIRHVLCVPLQLVRFVDRPGTPSDPRSIGVLYLDSREKGTLLSHSARSALETVATEAAAAIENARLYRQAMEKTRMDEELRLASQIQQALLPQAKKSGGFYEAIGASIACRAIGGDFFDYLEPPDGSFGFALGDVSGKGPPAALLTAVLQGMFSAQTFAMIDPRNTLHHVNLALLARQLESRFATVFFGVMTREGQLTYSNAGHNPPLLFGGGNMRRLETGGTLLGLFPQATYDQETVQLARGDVLVVFSDGVSEALSASGEEFQETRIQETVGATLSEPPERILKSLLDAVRTFTQGAPQNDDVTAMVVRYLG